MIGYFEIACGEHHAFRVFSSCKKQTCIIAQKNACRLPIIWCETLDLSAATFLCVITLVAIENIIDLHLLYSNDREQRLRKRFINRQQQQ